MGIEDSFIWYQKKIGTYDKQKWETTIEQNIINGLNHIPMRNTKPNTDLIDLDLVRGSSFTKAKPQHGFLTVLKQATLRCILLPLYAAWWIQRTSKTAFCIFLMLYLSLWLNIWIFLDLSNHLDEPDTDKSVPYTEIAIPFVMTWIMTLIFCQIVSTRPIHETPKTILKPKHYRKKRALFRKTNSKVSFADPTTTTKAVNPKIVINKVGQIESLKSQVSASILTNRIANTTNVKERKDEKINAANKECTHGIKSPPKVPIQRNKKSLGDDDGFESLCGNGSRTSEEENPTMAKCKICKQCNAWVQQVQEAKKSTSENRSNSESRAFSSDDESDSESNQPLRKFTRFAQTESTFDDTEDDCQSYLDPITYSADWTGVTTNSEDCSYSSDIDDVSDTRFKGSYGYDFSPTAILNPPIAKVSCTVWERLEVKKAYLSVLDISSAIIARVESMPESMDYFYVGIAIGALLGLLPVIRHAAVDIGEIKEFQYNIFEWDDSFSKFMTAATSVLNNCFGSTIWERTFTIISSLQRCTLATCYFFLLSVAERTFKQRFLYAKLFSHLTSFRRAQKSKLPHFRLNKVRNIKTWLSVRSYLKKRGPQRSVDVIVSTAFIAMLVLMSFLCIELLKDTLTLNSQYNIEALIWCFGLGILLLRFLTLGTKINKKYRNLSVLLTEQINLHLQIEQKPNKKEELNVANNVLKLAIDLLKELESPFKVIGLSANPILSNIAKVVMLSALSGVLSDMLGFKLKLHKIKIK